MEHLYLIIKENSTDWVADNLYPWIGTTCTPTLTEKTLIFNKQLGHCGEEHTIIQYKVMGGSNDMINTSDKTLSVAWVSPWECSK